MVNQIAVTQLKNKMKDGEVFIATLNGMHETSGDQDDWIAIILKKYKNVFSDELPPELSSSQAVDHKIEIILESTPLLKLTYRLS